MLNLCPVCGKDDAVQKVSSVVLSGQTSAAFSGPSAGVAYADRRQVMTMSSYTSLSGDTVSVLARMLAPPQPSLKESGGTGFLIGVILAAIVGCPALAMVLCGGLGVLAGLSDSGAEGSAVGFLSLLGGGVLLVPAILAGVFCYGGYRNTRTQAEARYADHKTAWDRAMERWNRLSFCHRDGVVFDPKSGDTCEPAALHLLVYR